MAVIDDKCTTPMTPPGKSFTPDVCFSPTDGTYLTFGQIANGIGYLKFHSSCEPNAMTVDGSHIRHTLSAAHPPKD